MTVSEKIKELEMRQKALEAKLSHVKSAIQQAKEETERDVNFKWRNEKIPQIIQQTRQEVFEEIENRFALNRYGYNGNPHLFKIQSIEANDWQSLKQGQISTQPKFNLTSYSVNFGEIKPDGGKE